MKSAFLLFLALLFSSVSSWAYLVIPKGLGAGDRKKALSILGFSSSPKVLGNPYPLGGFSGVEIGYATEVINTKELGSLGAKSPSQGETTFSSLTLGKGLYNNVDLYVQFTPFTQTESISSFGGQIRWGFYQAEYLPAHLTVVSAINSTNFQNLITTTTQVTDLLAGFSVQDVTLYTGVGLARTIGTFTGGANGITAEGINAREDISESHYIAGINIKFQQMFLAMQLDRHSQATYSAKLGLRF